MRHARLLALACLTFALPASAGVEIGGHLPSGIRQTIPLAQQLAVRGNLKGIRWVNQKGRAMTQRVYAPLDEAIWVSVPAGSWTDVELVFEEAPRVGGRSLPLTRLTVALADPVDSVGELAWLRLDGAALDGAAVGALSPGEIGRLLEDGLRAWVEVGEEDDD